MKRNYIYISIALLLFLFSNKINAQNTVEFEVDGLKVIYKHVPKEIVSVRFFIDGGTANYSKEQEGIENFALNLVVRGGTKSMDKIAFASELEKMGTTIAAGTTFDYGQFNMLCVKESWDKSWELFVDAIINPAFDADEFAILKEQLIAGAKQTEADPDQSLRRAAMENVYGGNNYAKIIAGTEASISAMERDDLINYYTTILGKKRSFIVIVGDLDKKEIVAKLESSLVKLPEGTVPVKEDRIMVTEAKSKVEDRDIATNYIMGVMSAPIMDSEDGVAMQLAMSILRERLFIEIRTKRGLSYAPAAFYSNNMVTNPYNAIYVSTTDPKASMEVMVDEIKKLKDEGFTEKELVNKQQSFLTAYYMGQETLLTQSNSLGTSELKGGWEMAEEFTANVNAVTLEDINRVIDKFTDVINWTYLGQEDQVKEEDFKQPLDLSEKLNIDSK